MKTLALAALTAAGLVAAIPSFAADSPAQTAPAVAVTPPPAAGTAQPKPTRHRKITNPHVLARPYASPHNGAASAIGAE
jgi:hypothetical protein